MSLVVSTGHDLAPQSTDGGDDFVHLHEERLGVVEATLRHPTAGKQHQSLHAVRTDGEAVGDAALAVLLGSLLFGGVKERTQAKHRISQIGHVQLADGAVGAAKTVQEELLLIAVGHGAQLGLQDLDSLAVARDGVVPALVVSAPTPSRTWSCPRYIHFSKL